jgi:hypothetical protein
VDEEVQAISAGWLHALYIKNDGTLMAMGGNDSGQLGDGTETRRLLPVEVDRDVLAIAAGSSHSLYIKLETFESWLENFFTEEEQQRAELAGENADPDGDGLTNSFEFLANLDPTSSESRLHYQYANDSDEVLRIWPMSDSSAFEIQTSTNMSDWSQLDSSLYQLSGYFLDIDLTTLAPPAFFKVLLSDTGH